MAFGFDFVLGVVAAIITLAVGVTILVGLCNFAGWFFFSGAKTPRSVGCTLTDRELIELSKNGYAEDRERRQARQEKEANARRNDWLLKHGGN